MAWIYLVELEESALHLENGLDQLPIVKSIHTVKECCYLEYPMEALNKPPYGMILEHLKQDAFLDLSISFQEAFHARISVLQDMDRAWQESEADYFSRSLDSVAQLVPSGSFWRMSRQSQVAEVQRWLGNLPRWGMTVDGALYPLKKLERSIKERDGFFWPTVKASDHKRKDSPSDRRRNSPDITSTVNMSLGVKNQKVNLNWLEWLMGYETGHTELKPWAMQWFQSKQKKRSKS